MSRKAITNKKKFKTAVATKYKPISDEEFWEAVGDVERRYGKALAELAKY